MSSGALDSYLTRGRIAVSGHFTGLSDLRWAGLAGLATACAQPNEYLIPSPPGGSRQQLAGDSEVPDLEVAVDRPPGDLQ